MTNKINFDFEEVVLRVGRLKEQGVYKPTLTQIFDKIQSFGMIDGRAVNELNSKRLQVFNTSNTDYTGE